MNCARSVTELIMRYWPCSIDILKPERAIIDGFRPIFFVGQGDVRLLLWPGYQGLNIIQADFEKSFFGSGQGEAVELAANQCAVFCLRRLILC